MRSVRVGQLVRLLEEDEGPLSEPHGVGLVTDVRRSAHFGTVVSVYWPALKSEIGHSVRDLRAAR